MSSLELCSDHGPFRLLESQVKKHTYVIELRDSSLSALRSHGAYQQV